MFNTNPNFTLVPLKRCIDNEINFDEFVEKIKIIISNHTKTKTDTNKIIIDNYGEIHIMINNNSKLREFIRSQYIQLENQRTKKNLKQCILNFYIKHKDKIDIDQIKPYFT